MRSVGLDQNVCRTLRSLFCGGEASNVVSAGAEPDWRRRATLRFSRLRDFGGLKVPPDEAVDALSRLGFTPVERTPTSVTVDVPSWRNDIARHAPLEPATATMPRMQYPRWLIDP